MIRNADGQKYYIAQGMGGGRKILSDGSSKR